jgi:hypothetical protein
VKAIFIAGLGAALLSSSTYAQQTQVVGQPVLRAPAPMAPEDLRSHPNFGQAATKLPRAARAPSTPESRSAAALAGASAALCFYVPVPPARSPAAIT